MKRWKLINNWIPCHGIGTFVLFNVWWSPHYIGVGLLNFAVEYYRGPEITVAELRESLKRLRESGLDV